MPEYALDHPLRYTSHRPWPLPQQPWVMWMDWDNLAFLHWQVDPEILAKTLPPGLKLDLFEGQAWLGVVPFEMRHVRPRYVPALPWISFFPELNVRTYVTVEDKPGVLFWSLDAANPLAVMFARRFFHLPYFHARMRCFNDNGTVHYVSKRTHRGSPPARFKARYRAISESYLAEKDSLEYWLSERYCYYTANRRGQLLRCHVHHQQWPLQRAEAQIEANTMVQHYGVQFHSEPLCHFVPHLRVIGWLPEKVNLA